MISHGAFLLVVIHIRKDEKEVLQYQLDSEKAILKELEKQYKAALEAIDEKVAALLGRSDANLQHVIFQVEHQKALRRQIEGVLNQLHSNEFDTISDYLANCYEDGFIGSMYSMHNQGIPVIVPIDQNEVTKAVVLDSKISEGLYESIGVDVDKMKKSIRSEITRGISAGMSYNEIARNISKTTKAPLSRAKTIVYTEGHRVQQASNYDGQRKAKSKGADVVKQWNSILDGNTRPTHRKLDGQIKEVEEPFEMDGKKAMYPGEFGDPAEDCNCRCVSMTRARWALDEEELQTLKDRAEYFGLDKSENFADFKRKYLKANGSIEEAAVQDKPKTIQSINRQATESLLDSYDDRRKHFSLNETTADELRALPNNPFTADYTGLSVETAEIFSDTITKLSDKYYTGFTKIEVADPKKMLGVQTFATTSHNNMVGLKTLTINPVKTKDYGKMVDRIEELQEKGHAVKLRAGKAGQYIPTHEFAHSLIDMESPLKNYVGMDVKMMKKVRAEIDSIFTRYKAEVEILEQAAKKAEAKFITANATDDLVEIRTEALAAKEKLDAVRISKYSMKNADEFLAEAFTQYHIGETVSQYSDEVMSVVDKYFGKSLENAGKNGTIKMGNVDVRKWYLDSVSKITEGIDKNLPVEEQARQAFEARNRIRTEARNMMADEETRKKLDKERPNKTFEELIESKMKRKGMTREEAIADIFKTAIKTNEDINKELGLGGG